MSDAPLRHLMPALAGKAYLNYGGQGPLPDPSLDAIVASWRTIQELGPFSLDVWPFVERELAGLRGLLAGHCGVPPHRVAFTENVTAGCVLPLWGLPWEPGDTLLISDAEHPGVVAACRELARREGLHISTLPVSGLRAGRDDRADTEAALLERLDRRLTANTRLVVLSHLLWNTGQVMPIAAVAERLGRHPRHPWLLVDAAQSMGSLPVARAASTADIYAFTGHKWCCGPEGLGAVVLSERLLEQARPTLIGWRSLRDEGNAEDGFRQDGRRFEVATSCTPLLAGLRTSLELLDTAGSAETRLGLIRERSGALWRELRRLPGVRPLLRGEPPAGLVSFQIAGHDPAAVVRRLGRRGVWIRNLDEPACLRACTHISSDDGDLSRLLEGLTEEISRP